MPKTEKVPKGKKKISGKYRASINNTLVVPATIPPLVVNPLVSAFEPVALFEPLLINSLPIPNVPVRKSERLQNLVTSTSTMPNLDCYDSDDDDDDFVYNPELIDPEDAMDVTGNDSIDFDSENDNIESSATKSSGPKVRKEDCVKQFKKMSTLILQLENGTFQLPKDAITDKRTFQGMRSCPNIIAAYWNDHGIKKWYSYADLKLDFPFFGQFLLFKESQSLTIEAAMEDESHLGLDRNLQYSAYLNAFSNFVNVSLFVNETHKILFQGQSLLFHENHLIKWIHWIQAAKYKFNSRKILIAAISSIVSWCLDRPSLFSPLENVELKNSSLLLRNELSNTYLLVNKELAERQLKEKMEDANTYLYQEEWSAANIIIQRIVKQFEDKISSLVAHQINNTTITHWNQLNYSMLDDATKQSLTEWLVEKIGDKKPVRNICGFRWYGFQKLIMFGMNLWCSPQRTENFSGLKIGAFIYNTGTWLFSKRRIEKQDRNTSATTRNSIPVHRQIPMLHEGDTAMFLWLHFIHPAIVAKFNPFKTPPKTKDATVSNDDIEEIENDDTTDDTSDDTSSSEESDNEENPTEKAVFFLISSDGHNYCTTTDYWTGVMYEITLELFGKPFHQQWLRNRMLDLLGLACQTLEQWKILCDYVSHTMIVHMKHYMTQSRGRSLDVYTDLAARGLLGSKNRLIGFECSVPLDLNEDDIKQVVANIRASANVKIFEIMQAKQVAAQIAQLQGQNTPIPAIPSQNNVISTPARISKTAQNLLKSPVMQYSQVQQPGDDSDDVDE